MTAYTDAYAGLLTALYREQPQAVAEISGKAAGWEAIKDVIESVPDAYDVDNAVGAQLSVIGDLVGLPRGRPEFVDDTEYRFYLKVKIAKNTGAGYMIRPDTLNSIQDVIELAFGGLAYVTDSYDMTMTLIVDPAFDISRLTTLVALDLLPKPQGVRYRSFTVAGAAPYGYSSNLTARGYGDKFDPSRIGGILARKVLP